MSPVLPLVQHELSTARWLASVQRRQSVNRGCQCVSRRAPASASIDKQHQ